MTNSDAPDSVIFSTHLISQVRLTATDAADSGSFIALAAMVALAVSDSPDYAQVWSSVTPEAVLPTLALTFVEFAPTLSVSLDPPTISVQLDANIGQCT